MISFRDVLSFKYRHEFFMKKDRYYFMQIIRHGRVTKTFIDGVERPK